MNDHSFCFSPFISYPLLAAYRGTRRRSGPSNLILILKVKNLGEGAFFSWENLFWNGSTYPFL